MSSYTDDLKVIIADKDLDTFKVTGALGDEFSLINLSSSFAVEFMLEYEKVDVLIINQRIGNLGNIIKRAGKKKVKTFIIGKDLKLPPDIGEIRKTLLDVKTARAGNDNFPGIMQSFKSLFRHAGLFHKSGLNKKNDFKEGRVNTNPAAIPAEPDLKELHDTYGQKANELSSGHMPDPDPDCRSIPKKVFMPDDADGCMEINQNNECMKIRQNKDHNNHKDHKENVLQSGISKDAGKMDLFSGERFKEKDRGTEIRTIKQKVIILARAKGGVGSTILSIYIGKLLDKNGINTLLVDLNFSEGGGDIGYYLNTPKTPNMINFTEGYSKESLRNSTIKISRNLDIIQSPPTYELSKNIDLQDIYCLTDMAKKKYHLIIFDLSNQFDDLWLGIIDLADLLIMVSDQTYGSVGRLLEIDARYLYGELDKFLIINRFQNSNSWDLIQPQIKNFLHLKDFVILREDSALRGVIEFSSLAFPCMDNFSVLEKKILDLLT